MTQTKTIICKKHGKQETYFIEHYGADGIRNDMVFCKVCRDSCKIGLGTIDIKQGDSNLREPIVPCISEVACFR